MNEQNGRVSTNSIMPFHNDVSNWSMDSDSFIDIRLESASRTM